MAGVLWIFQMGQPRCLDGAVMVYYRRFLEYAKYKKTPSMSNGCAGLKYFFFKIRKLLVMLHCL
jgi:hypothetical protein